MLYFLLFCLFSFLLFFLGGGGGGGGGSDNVKTKLIVAAITDN